MTEEVGVESEAIEVPAVDGPERIGDVPAESGDVVFMMAACEDATARPDLADFVSVEPRELSASNVSFYCNDAPAHGSIVLLMGRLQEDPIYVAASVTSCKEGFWERKRRYLVGCELTGRL